MNTFERFESNVRGYCRVWPAVFDKASNAKQWDVDGREYIDFFAGAGVLNFGHNNDRMRRAMVDYMLADGVAHSLDMSSKSKQTFIERFNEVILAPRNLSYKMQFTGPTGSNVVEAALKLSRKVTGRRNVVAFTNGFHGMTLGSLACTGNSKFRDVAGVALDNVIHAPFDGYLGEGVDTLAPLEAALKDPSSGMEPPAAFIVETIQAEGGVNVAHKEWLQRVQQLAHDCGALFIIDDIQCAIGRTGHYFSFETLDLDPDLICLAKGIGGYGTPLGVLLIKPEHDKWNPGEHTGTFRGQNLSFVAGTEALTYFEDDSFLKEVRDKGEHMVSRLQVMANGAGVPLRGRGMIQGLDFGSGAAVAAIVKASFDNGLLIPSCGPSGNVIKVMPPLTVEPAVLDRGLDIFEQAIADAKRAAA